MTLVKVKAGDVIFISGAAGAVGNGREREVACLDTIGAEQNLAQERSGARLKRAQERRGLQGVEALALRAAVRRHRRSESSHKHDRE